jgi:hypothetical protein
MGTSVFVASHHGRQNTREENDRRETARRRAAA